MRPAVEESIAALQRWEDAMSNLFLVAQICSLDDQTSSFKLTCMAAWWEIIRAFVFDWSGATSYMYVIAGFHIIVSYRRGEGGGGTGISPTPELKTVMRSYSL